MEGTDTEAIKQQSEALMKASHKLAEQMYAKAGPAGAEAKGPEQPKKPDETVVDAEFEEVK
jgi:molecular chaperone DnaK